RRPRPPPPKLPPYTTPFRSALRRPVPAADEERERQERDAEQVSRDRRPLEPSHLDARHDQEDDDRDAQEEELLLPHPLHGRVREDRKSTRLNSSHVKISYAV